MAASLSIQLMNYMTFFGVLLSINPNDAILVFSSLVHPSFFLGEVTP